MTDSCSVALPLSPRFLAMYLNFLYGGGRLRSRLLLVHIWLLVLYGLYERVGLLVWPCVERRNGGGEGAIAAARDTVNLATFLRIHKCMTMLRGRAKMIKNQTFADLRCKKNPLLCCVLRLYPDLWNKQVLRGKFDWNKPLLGLNLQAC